MSDTIVNHRCTLAGYPHIVGTVRGMYSPDNAYVEWDDPTVGAFSSYPLGELTILTDTVPIDLEPPF